MWRNIIKIALRNVAVHRGYSLINIFGLALGMGCALFALLWVQDELGHDRFHPFGKRLYRVIGQGTEEGETGFARTPLSLSRTLYSQTPWVAGATRYLPLGALHGAALAAVDTSFLDLFGFSLAQGPLDESLNAPDALVLTQALALRLFPDSPVLGQRLRLGDSTERRVTGVLAETQGPTHFRFEALVPLSETAANGPRDLFTYLLLKPQAPSEALSQWMTDHVPVADGTRLVLQPVRDIYLGPPLLGDDSPIGDRRAVGLIAVMGFFVLAAACVNFMNLVTARSGLRAREIGVRKVVGGLNRDLVLQFYGETLVIALLGLLLAMMLIELALPLFNQITGKHLESGTALMGPMLLGGLAVALVTGLVAGSYPALFFSRFQPDKVLRGRWRQGPAGLFQRRVLVVAQFTFSALLVSAFLALVHSPASEGRLRLFFGSFAAIAVAVSALGLLGLAVFMAERRVQEIGIRKMLGASVPGLLVMILREFALWVLLATALAWPLSLGLVQPWLARLGHPVSPSSWVWLETALLGLAVTVLSVGYQTVRSALSNPALTLRRR